MNTVPLLDNAVTGIIIIERCFLFVSLYTIQVLSKREPNREAGVNPARYRRCNRELNRTFDVTGKPGRRGDVMN